MCKNNTLRMPLPNSYLSPCKGEERKCQHCKEGNAVRSCPHLTQRAIYVVRNNFPPVCTTHPDRPFPHLHGAVRWTHGQSRMRTRNPTAANSLLNPPPHHQHHQHHHPSSKTELHELNLHGWCCFCKCSLTWMNGIR